MTTAPAAERVLHDVDRLLEREQPLATSLQEVAATLGAALDAQRVAIYGTSSPGDAAVRVRVEWSASERVPLTEWTRGVPLLTDRVMDAELVTQAPRGTHCPSDCEVVLRDCALRDACSTILQPLRVGTQRFGALAVHGHTGRAWTSAEQSLVRQSAYRVGLQIARARQAASQDQLDAQRLGIMATALHQLATPVTILTGVLDQLEQHADAPTDLVRLGVVECARLRRLCDDLSALATGATGTTYEADPCDVVDTVARAIQRAREQHRDATIDSRIIGDVDLARADAGELGRALLAVIENAVRYARGPTRVEVATWMDDDRIVLRIRDDGHGISAAEGELLAEPFARLDPDMRTQPGGPGLSLAVARQMARRSGGELHIEPRSDATGTQVTILLARA